MTREEINALRVSGEAPFNHEQFAYWLHDKIVDHYNMSEKMLSARCPHRYLYLNGQFQPCMHCGDTNFPKPAFPGIDFSIDNPNAIK